MEGFLTLGPGLRGRTLLVELDRAIAPQPGFAWALNDRAYLRAEHGQADAQALTDVELALRLKPLPQFVDTRGLVRLKLGDAAAAVADFRQALAGPGLNAAERKEVRRHLEEAQR